MKRYIMFFACLLAFGAAFAADPVQNRLGGMGIKHAAVKDNPSAQIKKMYTFDEGGVKGAIIVFYLQELREDVFATIVSTSSGYVVKSVELTDETKYKEKTLSELKQSLSKWDNMKAKAMPDAVSSATRHSRGIYGIIQQAVDGGITILSK